jgi:hypothetical protein
VIISENNITTQGGGLALFRIEKATVANNQIEHPSYTGDYLGPYDAQVYIEDTKWVDLLGNTISAGGKVRTASYSLRVRGTQPKSALNNSLNNNYIAPGHVGYVRIDGGTSMVVGCNWEPGGAAVEVSDNGIGTIGVLKLPALTGGWKPAQGGYGAPAYMKTADGWVRLSGSVSGGTGPILRLPWHFRPRAGHRQACPAGAITCVVQVDRSGDLRIVAGEGKGVVSLDGIAFPAE